MLYAKKTLFHIEITVKRGVSKVLQIKLGKIKKVCDKINKLCVTLLMLLLLTMAKLKLMLD